MNDNNEPMLTAEGAAKREAILRDATAVMVNYHRTRRRKRAAIAGAALVLLACGGAIVVGRLAMMPSTNTVREVVKARPTDGRGIQIAVMDYDSPAVQWRIIGREARSADQYKVRAAANIQRLDDAELAHMLDSINRPAGVITMNGRVRLTQNVVDRPTANDGGAQPSM